MRRRPMPHRDPPAETGRASHGTAAHALPVVETMIAHLTGTVACTEANSVILDVNSVGYRVFVPLSVLSSLPDSGGKATLQTVMSVREDDISLYGFSTQDEREVFLLLTGVTGVGPKVGLSMLSVYHSSELARMISSNDVKA